MIYLSGAISNVVGGLGEADRRFALAEQFIRRTFPNERVFNPCHAFKNKRGIWSYEQFMQASMDALRECSCLCIIRDNHQDFARSKGCLDERIFARQHKMLVFSITADEYDARMAERNTQGT